MKILVCLKGVPNLTEGEVKIVKGGRSLDLGGLPLEINDADNCAVEQAILLKEQFGGSVCTLTLGPKEQDVLIRMALARGCDRSMRIEYPNCGPGTVPLVIARILSAAIRGNDYDLIMTGVMTADNGHMAVGVALAQELGMPHASVVRKVEVVEGKARVVRELEGGVGELLDLALPAVLTIQTGINKPRYAQILGIKAAQKKELSVLQLADLGVETGDLDELSQGSALDKFYRPEIISTAEFIEGDLEAQAEVLAAKIIRAGGL